MHVITVAHDSPFHGHEKFDLVDGPGNDPTVFKAAVTAVCNAAINGNKPILVHCHGGRSRSAAVLVAAIARLNNLSVFEAYERVIAKHDPVRIHPAMSKLLMEVQV